MAGKSATAISIAAARGFVVARLAYVATHLADFNNDPLAIPEVWRGGFLPFAGVLAAFLILGLKALLKHLLRLIALLIALNGS